MTDNARSERMAKEKNILPSHYRTILNRNLGIFLKDAVRTALTNPPQAYFFLKALRWQRKAARIRAKWQRDGVNIPPIIIFSVTTRCNLSCSGCYAQALHPPSENEMSEAEIRRMMSEARELGVSFFVIAGGEPFLRPEIMEIMKDFPEILFLVFTNGLLIDQEMLGRFKKQRNVVPMVSLEGHADDTDGRRGEGVHQFLQKLIGKLRKQGIFFGTSLTITRPTFNTLTGHQFVKNLVQAGCRFFLYLEYTPTVQGTEELVLTSVERARLMSLTDSFRREFSALFFAIPGAEAEVGGCLAAGRGFVHVTAEGDMEPCPFASFSDSNLRDSSLKDALQSRLLEVIRQHPENLKVTEGGCTLWKRRAWVESLLHGCKEKDNGTGITDQKSQNCEGT